LCVHRLFFASFEGDCVSALVTERIFGTCAIAEDATRWFGRGLYNVAVPFDTRMFVVGGSIMATGCCRWCRTNWAAACMR
jgi:hypothetical protein